MESLALQPYRVDFACSDSDPLQRYLNQLYDYEHDIETKVLHRCRLNLFHGLMQSLTQRRIIASFASALDIGCNAGYYSKMIADCGFQRVVGVDIEAEFVRRAQENFGSTAPGRALEFQVLNAEELDRRQRFDFILCTEVIEHTSRPERVVASVKEMVAPGGVAIVTLPNACSLPYTWSRLTHVLKRKPMDPVLRDHLRYPFHRAHALFGEGPLTRIATTGTNLFWFGPTLGALYGRPGFPTLNRAAFEAARRWPMKYLAQFYFMVLKAGCDQR